MPHSPQQRTYVLFVVLALYIVMQFTWWAVLLVRKDELVSRLATEVAVLGGTPPSVVTGTRAMRMIVGEAAVFLLIVLVVLYLTWRAIRRDLGLARSQHNFLLAVTHELRSPIAGIKLQLQTLGRHTLDDDTRGQLLAQAVQETDRLAALTEKVLLTTRAEELRPDLEIGTLDVMEFLHDAVGRSGQRLAPRHDLVLEGPTKLEVVTDPEALRIIVDNLIENAAKYAPEGTLITLEVEGKREGWRLAVCDEGPGVPEEERSRIFEKFYRSGREETRRAKGTGLGLYIVRQQCGLLGGTISVMPRHPQGSIFVASFPNH